MRSGDFRIPETMRKCSPGRLAAGRECNFIGCATAMDALQSWKTLAVRLETGSVSLDHRGRTRWHSCVGGVGLSCCRAVGSSLGDKCHMSFPLGSAEAIGIGICLVAFIGAAGDGTGSGLGCRFVGTLLGRFQPHMPSSTYSIAMFSCLLDFRLSSR